MPQGHAYRRVLAAAAAIGGLVLCLFAARRHLSCKPDDTGLALSNLITEIAQGSPSAVDKAKAVADRDWPAAAPAVMAMLGHEAWPVRVAAGRLASDHMDDAWLAAVFPRASDADWRVRAAALDVLCRVSPVTGMPSRDTPLADRERALLEWLDARDAASAAPLAPDLCELYAADRHVEFGPALAARCLACHAGAAPAPFADNEVCGNCHGRVYDEWAASAHAQSLSHLHLATVNPQTRQAEPMEFGPVRGIGCRECHRPDGPPLAGVKGTVPISERPEMGTVPAAEMGTVSVAPAGLAACPFRFKADVRPGDSCARCHGSTQAEWRMWLQGPQPRLARWPPGQVEADHRGDTRTCVDCHMRDRQAPGEKVAPAHAWSARRDERRLREGMAVDLPAQGDSLRLTLLNLAGHGYPTGTRRRAVRVFVETVDGRPVGEAVSGRPLAELSPVRCGRTLSPEAQPALAPGERREFIVPLPAGGAVTGWRLLYLRDVTDPAAYTLQWRATPRAE